MSDLNTELVTEFADGEAIFTDGDVSVLSASLESVIVFCPECDSLTADATVTSCPACGAPLADEGTELEDSSTPSDR